MKKIAFLCVLSIVLFAVFYLCLSSSALGRPLGWRLLPLVALGTGALWSLFEALYTLLRLAEPYLKLSR
jgi:hypothetical protein